MTDWTVDCVSSTYGRHSRIFDLLKIIGIFRRRKGSDFVNLFIHFYFLEEEEIYELIIPTFDF